MSDKRKLTELTDPSLLEGEEVAAADGGLSQKIADIESNGGDYTAVNPHTNALGRYQFVPRYHWGNIKKVTGAKTHQEFLSSPQKQEDFFRWHADNNLAPQAEQLKIYNKDGYDDDQLKRLVHFKGQAGARKWLEKHQDDTTDNNVSIDRYIGKPKGSGSDLKEITDADLLEGEEIPTTETPTEQAPAKSTAGLTPNDPITGLPMPQAPEQAPVDRTQKSVDVLSKNLLSNLEDEGVEQNVLSGVFGNDMNGKPIAEAKKAYAENLSTVPFDQPGNILHDITNPQGDPKTTGDYAVHAVSTLDQKKKRELSDLDSQYPANIPSRGLDDNRLHRTPEDQMAYDQKVADVESRYDKEIQEMRSAAQHVTGLQLANKEFVAKKYTPEDSKQKIDEAKREYKEAMSVATGAGDVNTAKQAFEKKKAEIKSNTQYDPLRLGLEQARILGDENAEKDFAKYNKGEALDEQAKVNYEYAGLQAMQEASEAAKRAGRSDVYEALAKNSDNIEARLEKDNPKYFQQLWANKVGSYLYTHDYNPLFGTFFARGAPSREKIREAGAQVGLTPEQIRKIHAEDVPTMASVPGQLAQSAFNTFLLQNEKGAFGDLFTGKVPEEQHSLKNIRGILGEIAGGAGMVAGFMGQSAITGGALADLGVLGNVATNAKRYETASNLIPLAASNYNNAYESSKAIIGEKPEDWAKRHAYALVNSTISTAIMSLAPITALGKKAMGIATPAEEAFMNRLKTGGMEGLSREEVKSSVQKIINEKLQIAAATGHETIKQSAIMGSVKAAENVTNMLFDSEHRHGVMDEVGEAAIRGGIAMFVPSLMAARHAPHNNHRGTEALMWEVGNNSRKYQEEVTKAYKEGKMSRDEAMTAINGIDKAAAIVKHEVPKSAVISGKELTEPQRAAYAWNLFRQHDLNEKLEKLNSTPNPDKSQTKAVQDEINKLATERTDILNKAGDVQKEGKPLFAQTTELDAFQKTNKPPSGAEKKSLGGKEDKSEEIVSLTPQEGSLSSTTKTETDESISRGQQGQSNSETNEAQGVRPGAEDGQASSLEGQQAREGGELSPATEGGAETGGAAKEQLPPEPVSGKKKRKFVEEEETPPVAEEVQPETKAGIGEPTITKVDDGELHEFKTDKGLVAGVLTSPKEFRIDGISAAEVGKGHGSEMFEDLVGYLKEKGVEKISTLSAGEGAQKMHDAAVEKGLIREVKKDGRTAEFEIVREETPQEKPLTEPAVEGSVATDAKLEPVADQQKEKWNNSGTTFREENGKTIFTAKNGKKYSIESRPSGKGVVHVEVKNDKGEVEGKFTASETEAGKYKNTPGTAIEAYVPRVGIASAMLDYMNLRHGEIEISKSERTEQGEQLIKGNKKPETDASTPSEEQQQEVLQQGGEPEHARVEQARGKEEAAEAEGGDSDIRGEAPAKEKLSEVIHTSKGSYIRLPEGVKPGDVIRYEKAGRIRTGKVEMQPVKRNASADLIGTHRVKEITNAPNFDFQSYNAKKREIEDSGFEAQTLEEATLLHLLGGGKFIKGTEQVPGIEKHLGTKKGTSENKSAHDNWLVENGTRESATAAKADKFGYEFNDKGEQNEGEIGEILSNYTTKSQIVNRLHEIMTQRKEAESGKRPSESTIGFDIVDPETGEVETVEFDVEDPQLDYKVAKFMGYEEDAPVAFSEEGHPVYELGIENEMAITEAKLSERESGLLYDIWSRSADENGKINEDTLANEVSALLQTANEAGSELSPGFVELLQEMSPFPLGKENDAFIEKIGNLVSKYERSKENNAERGDGAAPKRSDSESSAEEVEQNEADQSPGESARAVAEARIKEIDLDLQRQRASQKIEHEKGKAATKAGDIAEINKHKDNYFKKQDRIDKLNAERANLQRKIDMREREAGIKSGYKSVADTLRDFGGQMIDGSRGMLGSFPLANPKLAGKLIQHIGDFVERLGNIHAAIYRGIESFQIEHPEEKLTPEHIQEIKDFVDWMVPPQVKEPVLSIANEEAAKDLLADIKSGALTYNEALEEIMAEPLSDKQKGKILNYVDWHLKDQEIHNQETLRAPKNESKYIGDYALTGSGETSTYLSGKTLSDVHGQDVQFDIDSKETQLQKNIVQDTANMVGLAKHHAGSEDVLVYGGDMLAQINKIPDGGENSVKKVLAVSGLNNELHGERVRLENELTGSEGKVTDERRNEITSRLVKLNKMIAEAELKYRDITSNASDVLNAARANRIFRNTYFHDLYADRILSEEQRVQKQKTEEAEVKTEVSDDIAEEGPMRDSEVAEKEVEHIVNQKEKSAAGKDVASDVTGKKDKRQKADKEKEKEKTKGFVNRLKERFKKDKGEKTEERKETLTKDAAAKKAEEYLGGSTIQDLFEKAKEQTKKPC